MINMYVCPGCQSLFIAQDEELMKQRRGFCAECIKTEILEMMGLPADFLSRRLGPC
jgi:hypothetical protein